MFVIKPIADIELHKKIAKELKTEYNPETLAYYAANIDSKSLDVIDYIGICQFKIGEKSEIVTLVSADGKENDEAMIILCRTVMSFLSRVGCKMLYIKNSAGPEILLSKCGFDKNQDGYEIDLVEFYKSPCKYNSRKKESK